MRNSNVWMAIFYRFFKALHHRTTCVSYLCMVEVEKQKTNATDRCYTVYIFFTYLTSLHTQLIRYYLQARPIQNF